MSRTPRVECDPHVIATFTANSYKYRIVAYDAGRMDSGGRPATPYYELAVDVQTENAMGEVGWVAANIYARDDQHIRTAKDHLLRMLLGLDTMRDGDLIEPRDRLGRQWRVLWGPTPGKHYDPEEDAQDCARPSGPPRPARNPAYEQPWPVRQTIWAPTQWAARAIFEEMHMEAIIKLWAATKPDAKAKLPGAVVKPWTDDPLPGAMLPAR